MESRTIRQANHAYAGEPAIRWVTSHVQCAGIESESFAIELAITELPNSFLAMISLMPVRFSEMSVPMDSRYIHFVFVEKGILEVSNDIGETFEMAEGDAFLVPAESYLNVSILQQTQLSMYSLQISNLGDLLPFSAHRLLKISRQSILLTPSREFLRELSRTVKYASGLAQYAAERILHELVSALVLDTEGFSGETSGANEHIRERVIALIAESKNSPDLSVEVLAQGASVSVRHLQRIFKEAGTTVTREIRRQRALAAHALLSQPRYDVLSVEQVAQKTGFAGSDDMRRALAEHFGQTPRQIRKRVASKQ